MPQENSSRICEKTLLPIPSSVCRARTCSPAQSASFPPWASGQGKGFVLEDHATSEWMRVHLPPGISLAPQERVNVGTYTELHFDVDLVLRDSSTNEVLCVLDTKYKDSEVPATDDVAQIAAYAEALGCNETVLVYPRDLPRPFEARVGDIRVRSLAFSLDGNVDESGRRFVRTVLEDTHIRVGTTPRLVPLLTALRYESPLPMRSHRSVNASVSYSRCSSQWFGPRLSRVASWTTSPGVNTKHLGLSVRTLMHTITQSASIKGSLPNGTGSRLLRLLTLIFHVCCVS